MTVRADELHRTAKLFVEQGRVTTLEDAIRLLRSFVLQVAVGPDVVGSPTREAALLTIINAGRRAFLGGVVVRLSAANQELVTPWAKQLTLSEAVERFGGTIVDRLSDRYPTVIVGSADVPGSIKIWPTWNGWSGGISCDVGERLPEDVDNELAGVLAAGVSVSEAFRHVAGSPEAGRRSVGISLWRPDLDWRSRDATGPARRYLPHAYWLPGLGHLGQAFSWLIGTLPYVDAKPSVLLQDFDSVVAANESTSLLATAADLGKRKTRLVASRFEQLGFTTALVERRFDIHTRRNGDEPLLCLAGFDHPEPRRALGAAGFDRVVDAGLGGGARYTDMLIQSFSARQSTADAFTDAPAPRPADELVELPAYSELVERLVAEGAERGEAECGLVEIAGTTVAASFVGVVAAAVTLSEPLRLLHGGMSCQVFAYSLRSPALVEVALDNSVSAPAFGYVDVGE
jgi:hypothetical protein